MTKKTLLAACALSALFLGFSRPASAALFINISDGLSNKGCDNGSAAGVAACGVNGFTTALDANFINFTGTFGGYTFTGASGVSGNVPGNSLFSQVSDSKLTVTHDIAGSGDLTVDFGAYNFTLPAGPNLTFSSSATANWTMGTSTDTSAFQAWARADNLTAIPGGTTAIVPLLTTPGGTTTSDSDVSPDVLFVRGAALNCFSNTVNCFSLTGREVIHQAVGTIASYQATETVLGTTAVPEPASMMLLGSGLVGLAASARRRLFKA